MGLWAVGPTFCVEGVSARRETSRAALGGLRSRPRGQKQPLAGRGAI